MVVRYARKYADIWVDVLSTLGRKLPERNPGVVDLLLGLLERRAKDLSRHAGAFGGQGGVSIYDIPIQLSSEIAADVRDVIFPMVKARYEVRSALAQTPWPRGIKFINDHWGCSPFSQLLFGLVYLEALAIFVFSRASPIVQRSEGGSESLCSCLEILLMHETRVGGWRARRDSNPNPQIRRRLYVFPPVSAPSPISVRMDSRCFAATSREASTSATEAEGSQVWESAKSSWRVECDTVAPVTPFEDSVLVWYSGGSIRRALDSQVDNAQLFKVFASEMNAGRGRYSHPEMVRSEKEVLIGDPDSKHVSTSFVERQKLSVRMESLSRASDAALYARDGANLADHIWTVDELIAATTEKAERLASWYYPLAYRIGYGRSRNWFEGVTNEERAERQRGQEVICDWQQELAPGRNRASLEYRPQW
jgi:hypothetical protein